MDKALVVLLTLVAYKILLLGIGIWASRRTRSDEDFFIGGRSLGPFVAALSYSSSNSSAWTLLGLSGAAYTFGVSTIWMVVGTIVSMLIIWFWAAPRLMRLSRDENCITMTEVLCIGLHGRRRSLTIAVATGIIVISYMLYVAAQFQGAGDLFASTFGLSATSSVLLGAAIIGVYTLLGGFWAVSVTDALQGSLMGFTALVLPLTAFFAVGGFDGLSAGLSVIEDPSYLSISQGSIGWAAAGFILGGVAFGIGGFGQPHLLVRVMALRDESAMRMARLITFFWFVVVFVGMWFVGIAGHLLHNGLQNQESIFFVMLDDLFAPVMGAIFLAAVLSAIMSTADSQLLVCGSAIAHDMALARGNPRKQLLISRLTIVALTLAAVVLTIYLPESIFSRVLFAWMALGSAFGPALLARLAGMPISQNGLLLSMVIGFVAAVTLSLLPDTSGDIAERTVPFALASLALIATREGRDIRRSAELPETEHLL